MSNKNLNKAKDYINDEFYTLYKDIEKELSHYKNEFNGKVVYCNCDNPYKSNFVKYFINNFNRLGLKELYATCYYNEPPKTLFSFDGDVQLPLINGKPYKMHVTNVGGFDENDIDEIVKLDGNSLEVLKWNGSYDSKECIEILKKCDIVVTNPPFSVFRKYMRTLFKYKVHYIILGPKHAVTCFSIFNELMHGRMQLGYIAGDGGEFQVMDDYDNFQKIENGVKIATAPIYWYTNVQQDFCRAPLFLTKKYSETEYKKYDNYDAIDVPHTCDIPMDYDGVMGVPISFLIRWCSKQFDIIGLGCEDTRIIKLYVDGQAMFARVLIKRKQ